MNRRTFLATLTVVVSYLGFGRPAEAKRIIPDRTSDWAFTPGYRQRRYMLYDGHQWVSVSTRPILANIEPPTGY